MEEASWLTWVWAALGMTGTGFALAVTMLWVARGQAAMRPVPGEIPWNGARKFLFWQTVLTYLLIVSWFVESTVGAIWTVLHPPDSPLGVERVRLMSLGRALESAAGFVFLAMIIATWYTFDRLQAEDDYKRARLLADNMVAQDTTNPITTTGPLDSHNLPPPHPDGPPHEEAE